MVHLCAFRTLSSPYLRSAYRLRYETMEVSRNWTEMAACKFNFNLPTGHETVLGKRTTCSLRLEANEQLYLNDVRVHGRTTYS